VRWLIGGPLRFDSFQHVSVFVLVGGFLAAFASSFLDAAVVTLIGWGEGSYWQLWRTRFFSNLLASVILVPVIVTWAGDGLARVRRAALGRWLECSAQMLGLVTVSVMAFTHAGAGYGTTPVLLYAPVPFLLWAAVRLGPIGTSTSLLVLLLTAVWGAIHGLGPFVTGSPLDSALSIQLFLIVLSVPLLFLTAVIEERQRSKAALRSSEERFAKAFMSSPDAMVITRTQDGRIVEVNDRWERLFGRERAQAVGSSLWELGMFAGAEDAAALQHAISSQARVTDLELALRSKSGELRQTIIGAETAEMGGEPCFIAIIRDLTDQRRAEREVQERQRELAHLGRVATVGELSGALAHELAQPLTAMLSNAEAAQRMLGQQPIDIEEVREILCDIVQQNTRVSEVIRRLRALFKKGETQFQPLDLNEVATEALELAHGDLITHGVSVATRLGEALPHVNGDRIRQAERQPVTGHERRLHRHRDEFNSDSRFADHAPEHATLHRDALWTFVLSRPGAFHHQRRDERLWHLNGFGFSPVSGERKSVRHTDALCAFDSDCAGDLGAVASLGLRPLSIRYRTKF
jgi:PAS domain S-box-containing protein